MKSEWEKSKKYWKSGETVHVRNLFGKLRKNRKSFDVQRRITSRDSRDGQHGIVRAGTDIQNRAVSFLLEAPAKVAQILWLWRLSLTRHRHNKQYQSQIPSFDSLVLSCTSESFKRQEARRVSMATRHWKAMNAGRGAWKHNEGTITIRWHKMRSTESLSEPMDGRKNIADTWTTLPRSTFPTSRHITRGIGTRTPSQ